MTRGTRTRPYPDIGEVLLTATLFSIYFGSRGAARAIGVAQKLVAAP